MSGSKRSSNHTVLSSKVVSRNMSETDKQNEWLVMCHVNEDL